MKFAWTAVGVVIAAMISIMTIFDYYTRIYIDAVTTDTTILKILPGGNFDQINATMKEAELLKHPLYWQAHIRMNTMSHRLKAGRYQITAEDTLYTVGKKLLDHDVLFNKFTIVEGWTLDQLLSAIAENPLIKAEGLDSASLKKHLNIQEPSVEGWLYPDTFLFSESILEVFVQAHEKMKETLSKLWQQRAAESPLENPYQALILASIVEKESGHGDSKNRVAGVFILRLKNHMRLQSDPTVIYGIGKNFSGNLTKRDLQTDTLYNTYIHKNLPPTPIAMPSESALQAVMQPEITGDLYFVSKKDGSHHFSKTYKEHQEAVIKYQLNGKY